MSRQVAAYAASALLLACVAGCGSSGSSDTDQIAAIVKSEGTDPASICRHLTQALLNRLGGHSACMHAAASSPKDPSTRTKTISVRGNAATAVVVDKNGTSTIALLKEKGAWKISAVR